MNVYGYSERGVLNSLLNEILYSDNGDALLSCLISQAVFPLTDDTPSPGTSTVLVEQSLSEFGGADVIIVTSSNAGNYTIFVEAKVTAQARDWKLSTEFGKFKDGLKSKVNSSNLLTQLYHKQRLVTVLKRDGIRALQQGVEFPPWSTNQSRNAGTHPVVLNTLKLIQRHVDNVYYLMLVPDTDQRASTFFYNEFRNAQFKVVPGWDVSHYGYLTWATVKSFCEQNQLAATLGVFVYNYGQIFPEGAA